MAFTEYETTLNNIERARKSPELEKNVESEYKLAPTDPRLLELLFKEESIAIEQIYLSKPTDEFSLRVRCEYTADGPEYSVTQKDRGETAQHYLARREVSSPITAEAYEHYQAMDLPRVRKLRATVTEGVTVDFYDDSKTPVLVEVEHTDPTKRAELLAYMQDVTNDGLVNVSAENDYTNEEIAFRHSGVEQIQKSPESLDAFATRIVSEMVAHYATGKKQVVAGLTGMSGSGKTTVTRAIQEQIVTLFGEEYCSIVISTDDYHFGKKALEAKFGAPYTAWDHAQTYDTEALAEDLARLSEGAPLAKRHFDFETEEPVTDGEVASSPFVVVEGLYAGSEHLKEVRDVHFTLPTGIATSIGRDVRRLVIDGRANRVFPTPECRLRYQIETALPLYLEQTAPARKPFSAYSRPLAERAFMLERLNEA